MSDVTKNVFILADASTLTVAYYGDCAGEQGNTQGNIDVNIHDDTTINLYLVTQNGPQGEVTIQSMDLPSQPLWLKSIPEPAGESPVWQFVASGGSLNDSASFSFTISNGTISRTPPDPTIINVDPPPPIDLASGALRGANGQADAAHAAV